MNKVIFCTDSYKNSQFLQYQANTTNIYSYFESRLGGDSPFTKTVFFGMQYLIKNLLMNPITMGDIDKAEKLFTAHMGVFNRKGWEYIVEKHGGYLPIVVKSVPEGTVIERNNALYTIENTDSECFWLTQWVETRFVQLWYTINVATISYYTKLVLLKYAELSSDIPSKDVTMFQLHNFSYRGVSSEETAALCGMAHLALFNGTDNVTSLLALQDTYNTDEVLGYSVVSSEHGCHITWGKDKEVDSYRNIIKTFGGKVPIFGMVIDSYDMENAIRNIIGVELKDEIIECGSRFTVRLDSGDPVETTLNALKWLSESFGYTVNSKGMKVLPDFIRVLEGDGTSYDIIANICDAVVASGFSIENVVFGCGGNLGQAHNRDMLRFAQKTSSTVANGIELECQKMPKTDPSKASKKGRLAVVCENGVYKTILERDCISLGLRDCLETVYEHNGLNVPYTNQLTFDEVRKNTGLW